MTLFADLWGAEAGLLQALATLYGQNNVVLLRGVYDPKLVGDAKECAGQWLQLQERHSVVKSADSQLLARERVGVLILSAEKRREAPRPLVDALVLEEKLYQVQEVQSLCACGQVLAYQVACRSE